MLPSPISPRTAAQVNAAIRALFRSGRRHGLGEDERPVYEKLLEEWNAADRAEKAAVRAEEEQAGFVRAA